MTQMTLTRRQVAAADILGGAQTLPLSEVRICTEGLTWISSATYLQWARRGLADCDDYGLCNAVSYAKLAVCQRIDAFLHKNHLNRFSRATYPRKIEILAQIGVNIPGVVHQLVVEPRNLLEHAYERIDAPQANRAVDIADLLLRATEEESNRGCIVALGWSVLGGWTFGNEQERVTFDGFSAKPMLFVDIFNTPTQVKLVFPDQGEMWICALSSFTRDEHVALVRRLRAHYSEPSRSASGSSAHFYRETKRLSGL